MACSIAGARFFAKDVGRCFLEGVWPCVDSWDVVRFRTSSSYWNVPGKYGPHSELFFFLNRKEPVALAQAMQFEPCLCGNAQGVCADWLVPFGQQKMKLDQAAVRLLI